MSENIQARDKLLKLFFITVVFSVRYFSKTIPHSNNNLLNLIINIYIIHYQICQLNNIVKIIRIIYINNIVEYYRTKHQKFTTYKMKWSMFISLVTNMITAPLELLKVRAQLLQEGRRLHGYGLDRGVPTVRVFNEIIESGYGLRSLWKG